MGDDPLLLWLKERLFGEQDQQEELALAAQLTPELEGVLEEVRGAAQQTLEIWNQLRRSGVAPPQADARRVLGLIVEIGFHDGTDTVVAYADGSSQFFSRAGAAILGEDPRPEVEEAARRLIIEAGGHVRRAQRRQSPRAPPGPKTVQFTFLTPSGPLLLSSSKAALWTGEGPLAPLFEPAAELIARKVGGAEEPEEPEALDASA